MSWLEGVGLLGLFWLVAAIWRVAASVRQVADAIDGVSHAQRQDTYQRAKLHGFLADEATKRAGNP